jgi:hypothetical protein
MDTDSQLYRLDVENVDAVYEDWACHVIAAVDE